MKGFRVYLDLDQWPRNTPPHMDYLANFHTTGPDGSLFLSWREHRNEGVDLASGMQRIAVENRPVVTLRGGMLPLWRSVEPVELGEDDPAVNDDDPLLAAVRQGIDQAGDQARLVLRVGGVE